MWMSSQLVITLVIQGPVGHLPTLSVLLGKMTNQLQEHKKLDTCTLGLLTFGKTQK